MTVIADAIAAHQLAANGRARIRFECGHVRHEHDCTVAPPADDDDAAMVLVDAMMALLRHGQDAPDGPATLTVWPDADTPPQQFTGDCSYAATLAAARKLIDNGVCHRCGRPTLHEATHAERPWALVDWRPTGDLASPAVQRVLAARRDHGTGKVFDVCVWRATALLAPGSGLPGATEFYTWAPQCPPTNQGEQP